MSTTVRELARQRPVEVTPGVSLQGGMLTLSDSGQGIHVAGAADLNFSGDCCIEWFGRITAMSSNGHLLVGQGETLWNGTDVAGYYFTYSPNNKLYAWAKGNLAARDFQVNISLVETGPHHIAMDRAGTTVRLFIDGELVGSLQNSGETMRATSSRGGYVSVGTSAYGFPGYTGELSWCRLTNASRYTSNFVPAEPVSLADPLWSETVLLIVAGNVVKTGLDAPSPREIRGDVRTFFDLTTGADYGIESMLLATDDGLTTAVLLSLFTDARARPDDRLPHSDTDRRGWWGDAWPMVSGESMGSRLWLVWPGKQTGENLQRAREYAQEALQWLVTDGIASSVEVQASNPRNGVLALSVKIFKPAGEALALRFESLWSAT